MKIEQFIRKSFPVEAVRVTAANIEEVANWCGGTIRTEESNAPYNAGEQYIKVRVETPLTPRQTMAFVGDWVLYAGKGYKVYKDKPFRKSFDSKQEPRVLQGPRRIESTQKGLPDPDPEPRDSIVPQNVFEGEGVQPGAGEASFSASAGNNPGGGHKLG